MSGSEALKVSMGNPSRGWQGTKSSARTRLLANEFFPIQHKPKFLLDKSQKFFTVGSCFAREIEYKLAPLGVPLLLRGRGLQRRYFRSWPHGDDAPGADAIYSGVFNKYTTASIEHEFKRTILRERYPQEGLIEIEDELWFDPHSSGLKNLPLEQALANRAIIDSAMQLVREADIVVMTLGQTEGWLDSQTGIAMNTQPGPAAVRRFKDRFVFIDHSYRETVEQVDRTIKLIRQECNPRMRFIVTVSPVPFNSTFRAQDVVVAHQATKSMLRAVAEELFRSYEFVDYFPSYEMVINTGRNLAWLDDQLHVDGEMVRHIMGTFYQQYYPEAEAVSVAPAA
ncbi:GSCFA domain-containing protein [Falsiroseomonas selenitidurans]|uniref:GSCFA domain-containing protein n=1 Tax=Falsiroseomonas selenitidurans TaxID=2716335 RepID=A0ABX1E9E1_9PROT|nr:GSCFA domain-containing protein [Falsiroseomonas selenitidurans]NKC33573.1 GSCFA domain-containing protein [Falsiroseomonas selenitidurans]